MSIISSNSLLLSSYILWFLFFQFFFSSCAALFYWKKCNTDGASTTDTSAYGGIFRNHLADFRCGFAENIDKNSVFFAEILGAIRAIEIAYQNHWFNLWLRLILSLLSRLIPLQLRNRWLNSLVRIRNMNFFVFHIYREDNECAYTFANKDYGDDRRRRRATSDIKKIH
jgi:hypothetical protein